MTSNLAAGPGERTDNWQGWLACVLPQNKPIGLAEYGLNPNGSDPAGTASAIAADSAIWRPCRRRRTRKRRCGNCGTRALAVESWAIDDEPAAVSAWKAAETQNGGG